jgi:hypothetical protein
MIPAPKRPTGGAEPRLPAGGLDILLAACALAAPLLIPPLGAGIVPADGVFIIAIVVSLPALWKRPWRLHLGFGWTLFMLGGMLALSASVAPASSTLTLVQDAYLFVFFLAVANLLRAGLGRPLALTTAWIATSVAVATLNLLATVGVVHAILGSETLTRDGRAAALLGDPNLTGNYLSVSLFVLWAAPRPARLWTKLAASAPLLIAIALTASNTALLSSVCGLAAALACGWLTRHKHLVPVALPVLGAFSVAFLVVGASLLPPVLTSRSPVGDTVLSSSLGRLDDGAKDRRERLQQAGLLLGGRVMLGIGPNAITPALARLHAPITGEIHNDVAAAFLERGIVGGIGAIAIFTTILIWAFRAVSTSRLHGDRWRPEALVGAAVATVTAALTLEVLHFRHVWLLLALLAALVPSRRDAPAPGRGPALSDR